MDLCPQISEEIWTSAERESMKSSFNAYPFAGQHQSWKQDYFHASLEALLVNVERWVRGRCPSQPIKTTGSAVGSKFVLFFSAFPAVAKGDCKFSLLQVFSQISSCETSSVQLSKNQNLQPVLPFCMFLMLPCKKFHGKSQSSKPWGNGTLLQVKIS